MSGWVFRAALLLFLSGIVLAGPESDKSGVWEIEATWGPWTLSPFRSPLERETEAVIRDEFGRLIESAFLERVLSLDRIRADLDSSGQAFTVTAWRDVHKGTVFLGLRISRADFRIPFRISSRYDLHVFGVRLGELETHGEGTVRIRSTLMALLARWNVVRHRAWEVSLYGGAAVLPFQGDLEAEGTAVLRTPLGDISAHARDRADLDEIRAWNSRVPGSITAPLIGAAGRVRISKSLGVILDVSFGHGTAAAAGFTIVL